VKHDTIKVNCNSQRNFNLQIFPGVYLLFLWDQTFQSAPVLVSLYCWYVARTVGCCFRQLRLLRGYIRSPVFRGCKGGRCCLSSPLRSTATTADGLCTQASPGLPAVTGGSMTMLRRSSLMSCIGCRFLYVLSLKSVCWYISHFTGLHLSICAITVSDAFIRFRVDADRSKKLSSLTTDENPLWWPRFLSGCPQKLERSSSCPMSGWLDWLLQIWTRELCFLGPTLLLVDCEAWLCYGTM